MLTIVGSPTAITAASSTSSASYAIGIAVASNTAPVIGIVMIPITIFSVSIIGLVWILPSHLSNYFLLLICLPLLAVHVELIL
jgi:hypothetical protein